jgi:F0F1-type ATP synthase membrane subunit a
MLDVMNRSKGMLLLGVWVLLSNLLPLLSLRIPNGSILLTILGMAAGVLLLVDR